MIEKIRSSYIRKRKDEIFISTLIYRWKQLQNDKYLRLLGNKIMKRRFQGIFERKSQIMRWQISLITNPQRKSRDILSKNNVSQRHQDTDDFASI